MDDSVEGDAQLINNNNIGAVPPVSVSVSVSESDWVWVRVIVWMSEWVSITLNLLFDIILSIWGTTKIINCEGYVSHVCW